MAKLLIKRTTTPGKVPTTADLVDGELAANLPDGKLYVRHGSTIKEMGGGTSSGGITEEDAIAIALAFGG